MYAEKNVHPMKEALRPIAIVVADDAERRRSLARPMGDCGYRVHRCSTDGAIADGGASILESRNTLADTDLMIVDFSIGRAAAERFVDQLRLVDGEIPILATVGSDDDYFYLWLRADSLGLVALLCEPLDVVRLVTIADQLVAFAQPR